MRIKKLSNEQAESLAIELAKKLIHSFDKNKHTISAKPDHNNQELDGKTHLKWLVTRSLKNTDGGESFIEVNLSTQKAKYIEFDKLNDEL
jgi:hypothetical protein